MNKVQRLCHHSGRFDDKDVISGFKTVARSCTLATHTELANNARAAKMKAAAKEAGWGFYQDNRHGYDDLAFTWDQDAWKRLDTASKKLSEIPTWSTEGEPRAPFCAVAMHLEALNDHTHWAVITMHTPSHVAIWDKWRPSSSRTRQYQDGMKTMATWVRQLRNQWRGSRLILAADWNAPMEQPWFRSYLEKTMPAQWKVMAANDQLPNYPDTHDNRCIDWAMVGPKVRKRAKAVARKVPDSDHKALFYQVSRVD